MIKKIIEKCIERSVEKAVEKWIPIHYGTFKNLLKEAFTAKSLREMDGVTINLDEEALIAAVNEDNYVLHSIIDKMDFVEIIKEIDNKVVADGIISAIVKQTIQGR